MANDYRQRIAEAIAAKFTYPDYRCDRDGENERVENPEPADRIDQTPYVMAAAGEGYRSWTPTCAELADVITDVRDQDAETLRSDNEELRKRADAAEQEVARLQALLDGHEVADDESEPEPGFETVTAHLGELRPIACPKCGSDDLLAATIYGLTSSSSRVMGEMAVCHGCGWSPYGDAVLVARADLDLVMNHAGNPSTVTDYPAACQRIRDALDGGQRA